MGAIIKEEAKELYLNFLKINEIKKEKVDELNENGEVIISDRRPATMVVQRFLSKGGILIDRVEKPFMYNGNGGDIFDQAYSQILPSYDVTENVLEEGQVIT